MHHKISTPPSAQICNWQHHNYKENLLTYNNELWFTTYDQAPHWQTFEDGYWIPLQPCTLITDNCDQAGQLCPHCTYALERDK